MRVEAEHRATAELRRPLFHVPDVQVAVLDGPREVSLLERRTHPRALRGRYATAEHQRLGAAADPGPHSADDHVVPPGLGKPDLTDLSATRGSHPECTGDPVIEGHVGILFARVSHKAVSPKYVRPSPSD